MAIREDGVYGECYMSLACQCHKLQPVSARLVLRLEPGPLQPDLLMTRWGALGDAFRYMSEENRCACGALFGHYNFGVRAAVGLCLFCRSFIFSFLRC